MTNTTSFKQRTLWLALSSIFVIQGCAIPNIDIREPEVNLPKQYPVQTDPEQHNAGQQALKINWRDWFHDPQLSELIDIAINNNQEMAILLQRINMAANEVYAREGEYLPSVSVGIAADAEKVGEFTREGAVEEQLTIKEGKAFDDPLANLRLGLNASWEVDIWHKLRDASKVASLEYMASVEGRKFFITQLVSEVSRCYYELLALDNKLATLDATIVVQKKVITTLNSLKQYGRSTSLPVSRFSAEINKNESERFLLKQEIVEKENTMNLLLGRLPQTIPRNSDILLHTDIAKPNVGVPSELLANRADIRQAELSLAAAKLNIGVAKANFYPSFELRAGVGLSAFDPRYLFNVPESLTYSLTGDLFSPLINRRAIEATYQNASAEQVQAAFEYELAIIRAVADVSNSLSKLTNLQHSVHAKALQVASLDESVDIASLLFSSAHGEYLEVLLAQREALEARSEYIEARQQQMSALVDLYQALGGGWQS